MTFNFGQLPLYIPKPPANEALIKVPASLGEAIQQKAKNSRGVFEIQLEYPLLKQDLIPTLTKQQIGLIKLTKEQQEIGVACVTPIGNYHVELFSGIDQRMVEEFLKESEATTLAFQQPTKEEWKWLQELGFKLRPELVRHFAHVGSKDHPFEHLSGSRAKKMRANIRKAEKHLTTTAEPLSVENFTRWFDVYKREVVDRDGGFAIFYNNLFREGQHMDGLKMISCFHKDTNAYLGGCVVNPWGEFGDIGKERKFTSFLLSALSQTSRPFAAGYLLDKLVMDIARDHEDRIYGHGGDLNFWGTDTLPGLQSRKSAAGMVLFPDMTLQAFKVLDKKAATQRTGQCFFFELVEPNILQSYFEKRDQGWTGSLKELYPEPWNHPELLDEVHSWWKLHHIGDKQHLQLPEQMKTPA